MLNDIEDGKDEVSFVLVFKLSRFGRNAADVLSSLQLMQDYGVNLICVEDNIDSSKEAGKLLISIIAAVAEMERENIRVQTMAGRMQKAREGKWNGGFSTSFVKKIIDNPIYMGKIAYGRRRTEKKNGTRNETHVVEQSEYPIYEGIHEAIISEEEWNMAQEKRSKNNYRREKVNDPDQAHILSGILRCPCCGKGMYGNVAKAHSKDNKTRYYYYCKNTVNATGHKCTFRTNIEQSQMDSLDVNTPHYEKKIADLQRRLDSQYDTIDEVEQAITEVRAQIFDLKRAVFLPIVYMSFCFILMRYTGNVPMQKRRSSCSPLWIV